MNDNIAIKLTKVIKSYEVYNEKPTLLEKFVKRNHRKFVALNNINLTIKKGEQVGIIGSNGAGKTTLLKIITGVTTPTKGNVLINGRIVSLIDLEAGFHPDLTGTQNIFLNGMLLGMSKKEIDSKLDNIKSFANIGKFIDSRLFTYSSGMKLRLGFSIAVHSNPDILVLDENIAVGDQNFAQESFKKIQEFLKNNKTIIIASHNMSFIKKFCKRVIWLKSGKIKLDSISKRTIASYEK